LLAANPEKSSVISFAETQVPFVIAFEKSSRCFQFAVMPQSK